VFTLPTGKSTSAQVYVINNDDDDDDNNNNNNNNNNYKIILMEVQRNLNTQAEVMPLVTGANESKSLSHARHLV